MKKVIMFLFLFISYPIAASINCLDNSKHLQEDFDDKEWHSVACDCPCQLIRKNICTECGHLQNAATYVVVIPPKIAQNENYPSYNPQKTLRQLACDYLQKKK
jgi:hypothetical protein